MTPSTTLAVAAAVAATMIVGALEYRSRSNVVTAGFWFDEGVTFDLHAARRIGGPLTVDERERIKRVAREEVERAFDGFRLRIVDSADAFYRVGVQQVLLASHGKWTPRLSGAAGQSNVFGPLGGYGGVSFYVLAAQAIHHAPPGATRADIVEGIGRGIGRAAVHELAHQILPSGPMHNTPDAASYEYRTSDRPAQYYGEIHWSVARQKLEDRLAR
jgi:hypothetical protein